MLEVMSSSTSCCQRDMRRRVLSFSEICIVLSRYIALKYCNITSPYCPANLEITIWIHFYCHPYQAISIKLNNATLCRNWHFVWFGAPTVSECNTAVVNTNPRSIAICQMYCGCWVQTKQRLHSADTSDKSWDRDTIHLSTRPSKWF